MRLTVSTILYLIIQGILFSSIFSNSSERNILSNKQDEILSRDTSYVRDLNERSSDLIEKGKLDSASTLIHEASNLADFLNYAEGKAFAVTNLAKYYDVKGVPDSILTSIEPILSEYRGTKYYLRMGNLVATANHNVGNFQRSLELYKQMLDLAIQEKDTSMQIGITQNMGNSYGSLGDIPSAIDSYLNSLEMAEEQKDTVAIAVVLDNLASLNVGEGNYELAEDYLIRALDLNRQINNLQNQITNHMSLGILYKDWEKYETALEHYQRVLEIAEETGNVIGRIQGIYNLGVLYTQIGDTDLALQSFQESLRLSEENNIHIGFFYNRTGMGDLFVELGDYDRAIENYQEGLEIAELVQSSDLIRNGLSNLYETAEKAGDTAFAYSYLKRYSSLTDSLAKTEREEALARQETLLGLRSEQKRSELLERTVETQRTNTIIISTLMGILIIASIWLVVLYRKQRKAHSELEITHLNLKKTQDQLIQQEKLASLGQLTAGIAHEIRNPLNFVNNFSEFSLDIVEEAKEKLSNLEAKHKAKDEILYELQNLNGNLNKISEHGERADKIVQSMLMHSRTGSGKIEPTNLNKLVKEATNLSLNGLKANNKSLSVDLDFELNENIGDVPVIAEDFSRAIINICSNALEAMLEKKENINSKEEYFPKLRVRTKRVIDSISIDIEDNGPGIPVDLHKKIFQPFFTTKKGAQGTGLGLSMTNDIVNAHGGNILIKSEPGLTCFTITLSN